MFLDIVFNFCCSKRQKDEPETISQKSQKSEEDLYLEQRRQELDLGRVALAAANRSKPQSSVGSPTDNYLNINGQPERKKGSFEEDEPIEEKQALPHHLSKTTYHASNDRGIKRSLSSEKAGKVKKKIAKKSEEGKRVVKIWEPSEDANLKKLYEQFQGNWHKVVQFMPGRNISQCSQRWRRINPIQVKQKWTFEEDKKLIELVQQKGKNWTQLAKEFPGRSGKQIRERYLNKLDPSLKCGPWSEEEDLQVLKYYKEYGAKWSLVAQHLQGRSENQVKNRFYSHIQKHILGLQNKYQIVFNTGAQEGVNQTELDNQDSSSSQKQVYSENYSSSFGSSTFTYSFYDEDEDKLQAMEEEHSYNDFQFQNDFDKVVIN